MPREIIIFGRRFGYTPANTMTINNKLQNNENPLKDMIKQHMKEEQFQNVTLTYDNKIKGFIKQYDDLIKKYSITSTRPLEYVDIDGDDEEPNIESESEPTVETGNKLVLDVSKIMESGGMLVNDICRDIRIKLDKEEIANGKLNLCFVVHRKDIYDS